MTNDKMTVLIVEPNEHPRIAVIGKDLHSLQEAVGGLIDCRVMDEDGTMIVFDDESKLKNCEGNRHTQYGVIAGTFFVCGTLETDDGNEFCSLSKEKIDEYMDFFFEPELITPEEVQADMDMTFIAFG